MAQISYLPIAACVLHFAFYVWHFAFTVEMDQWTGVHRAFIIRAYYKSNDSISAAQRLFKKQFSIYQTPPTNVIKSWLRTFEGTGSSQAGGGTRSSLPQIFCTICNNCLSNEKNFSSSVK
ncbi:Hypothetical predicted protein [Drosophila guanche]|uniref:DUF4817 domain-containing protein n=1 Tax=Drosophila guanche TaxID=7266 RepID=A0A3B0JQ56_DROGU|nr:Hypothetical predicted protein [Drosophila guanche]